MAIDAVDYALLKCIREADVAPWKKRVYELVHEQVDELPRIDSLSLQTVGRRIDRLEAEGRICSCIVSGEQCNRKHIVGYHLTDDGERALLTKREELLCDYTFGGDPLHVSRRTGRQEELVALFADTFQLSDKSADILAEFSPDMLTVLSAACYLGQHVDDLQAPENRERIKRLVDQNPQLDELLGGEMLQPADV